VGAGSVVMRTVPAHVTVAGVLARVVGVPGSAQPALEMDQEIPSTLSLLAEQLPSGDVH
jgi:serine O-acetyltransferase